MTDPATAAIAANAVASGTGTLFSGRGRTYPSVSEAAAGQFYAEREIQRRLGGRTFNLGKKTLDFLSKVPGILGRAGINAVTGGIETGVGSRIGSWLAGYPLITGAGAAGTQAAHESFARQSQREAQSFAEVQSEREASLGYSYQRLIQDEQFARTEKRDMDNFWKQIYLMQLQHGLDMRQMSTRFEQELDLARPWFARQGNVRIGRPEFLDEDPGALSGGAEF